MAEIGQGLRHAASENDENALGARNRGKASTTTSAVTSRPALGTITNKGGRVQPGRAAKVRLILDFARYVFTHLNFLLTI